MKSLLGIMLNAASSTSAAAAGASAQASSSAAAAAAAAAGPVVCGADAAALIEQLVDESKQGSEAAQQVGGVCHYDDLQQSLSNAWLPWQVAASRALVKLKARKQLYGCILSIDQVVIAILTQHLEFSW
jgi:hypothetical protein